MDLAQTCLAMATLYALLSVVASAMKEALEAAVQKRKQNFRDAIKELLGSEGAQAFLAHPRIQSLTSTIGGANPEHARHWPTYVDAATFAAVAQDIVQTYPDGQLAKAADWARGRAQNELDVLQTAYNERMERLSGSFKRNAQSWLIGFGFVLAVCVDADTVQLVRQMSTDTATRAALVNLAGRVDSQEAVQALCLPQAPGTQASVPAPAAPAASGAAPDAGKPFMLLGCIEQQMPQVLGWSEKKFAAFESASGGAYAWNLFVKFLGYVLTALAISLGAPFWFDLINKVANLRATRKPTPQ